MTKEQILEHVDKAMEVMGTDPRWQLQIFHAAIQLQCTEMIAQAISDGTKDIKLELRSVAASIDSIELQDRSK